MQSNFTSTLFIVLTSIVICIRVDTTIVNCCNSNSNIQTVQHANRIMVNNSNDTDGVGDNNDSNKYRFVACKAQCDAQWKSDFYMHFQKNYDDEFYEFPLDATITATLDNFYAFCNITEQKVACWRALCRMDRNDIAWSSELHICALKKSQFEKALNCFNVTSSGAHNECNEICRKIGRRYRTLNIEKQYLHEFLANSAEIYQYRQLNKQCAFQICQLECRKELMRNLCQHNETTGVMDTLQDYYRHDLLDQMRSLTESSTEHLYPLMCRQYLPVQYHLRLSDEANNEIKQAILSIKYAVNGITEMLTES